MGKIKLGFIGTNEIDPLISNLSSDFKEVQITKYYYQFENEALSLAKQAEKENDVLLFGGPVPFHIVTKNNHVLSIQHLYISFDSSALYRGLLKMIYQSNQIKNRFSIDTISEEIVYQVAKDLGIQKDDIFTTNISTTNSQELTLFHEILYQNNQTEYALTCLRTTYQALQKKNIPSILILSPETTLKEMIQKAILLYQSEIFRKSQIIVGNIHIYPNEKVNLPYTGQMKELEIHHTLVKYAEEIHAALFPLQHYQFIFYTTLGMIERDYLRLFYSLIYEIKQKINASVAIGLGIGTSAQIANQRSIIALEYSKKNRKEDSCYIVETEGKVINILESENKRKQLYRTEDLGITTIAEEKGISPIILTRIVRVIEKLNKTSFTSDELAIELVQTQRNIRRILNTLVEKGLARRTGEEHYSGKGRPKTIYQIDLIPP